MLKAGFPLTTHFYYYTVNFTVLMHCTSLFSAKQFYIMDLTKNFIIGSLLGTTGQVFFFLRRNFHTTNEPQPEKTNNVVSDQV